MRHAHLGVVQRYYRFLDTFDLTGSSIGIAYSGGPDSTALAICAIEAFKTGKLRAVVALHVNHGVRSESDRDAESAMENACWLGIPFDTVRLDLPRTASEGVMRDARYGALAEIARAMSLDCVMTGHHSQDQAETVMLHLIRGTGLEGLAAIAPDESVPTATGSLRLVRPFLTESPADLAELVTQAGVVPVADATNSDTDKSRNWVRHNVLPTLLHVNPQAVAHIAQTADIVRSDNSVLAEIARAAMPVAVSDGALSGACLAELDPAIQRRVISIWIHEHTEVELSFERCEAVRLAALAGTGGIAMEIGNGWTARQSDRRFTLLQTRAGIGEIDVES